MSIQNELDLTKKELKLLKILYSNLLLDLKRYADGNKMLIDEISKLKGAMNDKDQTQINT
jgi:hypothetical protein